MNPIHRIYCDTPYQYLKGQIIDSITVDKRKYVITKVFNGTVIEHIKKFFNKDTKITSYIEIITFNSFLI